MKRRTLLAACLLALSTGASMAPALAADTGPIRIGVLAPLTGAGGPYGPIEAQAARKAAEYINNAGGVLGRKIEILVEDDETNPTAGVAGARKLIDVGNVVAISGVWASGVALAVKPIAIERGVALYANGSANELTQGDNRGLVWRFIAQGDDWGAAFGRAAATHKPKTVSILVLQNPFTLSFVNAFKAQVESSGAKVLDVVPYNPNQPSYRAEVEKVFSKNPDLVFAPGYVTDFSAIAREIYRSGYNSRLLTLTHAADSNGQFTRNVGKAAAEGVDNVLPVPDAASKTFALYRKLTGTAEGSTEIFGPSVFDQIVLTALAIEKSKSTDAKVYARQFPSLVNGSAPAIHDPVDALKAIRAGTPFRYSGAYADFGFRDNGDPTGLTYGLYRVHDGVNSLLQRFK